MILMPKFHHPMPALTRAFALACAVFVASVSVPGMSNLAFAQGNSGQDYPGQRGRERAAERAAEHAVENILKKAVEAQVEGQVENSVEAAAERQLNNASDRANEVRRQIIVKENAKERGPVQKRKVNAQAKFDRRVAMNIELDGRGFPRVSHRWLIMTNEATLKRLEQEGYVVDEVNRLDGLDSLLVELVEREGADLNKARKSNLDVVSQELEIDFDHLYQPDGVADDVPKLRKDELSGLSNPSEILSLPVKQKHKVTLGVIDSAVDKRHDVFDSSKLKYRDFVDTASKRPMHHGTAVASILVGRDDDYQGLVSDVTLYSAGVFFEDANYGERATVKSLVLAINWMAEQNIDVVNVSLTGPSNRILQLALRKLYEKGAMVVAAVGNEGPSAKPLYPAAYDFVVAVTATNEKQFAYYKANRGKHVDISAPGVTIKHAHVGGGYSTSSGTSFAAPFVSAYLVAELAGLRKGDRLKYREEILRTMYRKAKDLGILGRDHVYGHGLLQSL